MLRIGITGGIGTGKTTICKIFELLGIPIFYADTEAKKLYDTNESLKMKVIENFGADVYMQAKSKSNAPVFDKNKMKAILVENPEKLQLLNALVHPLIQQETDQWFAKQSAPYAIKEAALIVETKTYSQFDELILVEAPLELRMKRIEARDLIKKSNILHRINVQLPEIEKKKFATQFIVNDENHLLIPQVLLLHDYFIGKALK